MNALPAKTNFLDIITNKLRDILNKDHVNKILNYLNIVLICIVIYKIIEFDIKNNSAYDEEQFTLFFYASSFLISSFSAILFLKTAQASKDFLKNNKQNDLGFLFIALASTTWAMSSLIIILMGQNTNCNNNMIVKLFFGDLNTLFFTCSIAYLDYKSKPVLLKKIQFLLSRNFIFIIFCIIIIWYTFLKIYNEKNNLHSQDRLTEGLIITIILSGIITIIYAYPLFFYSFYHIFKERINKFKGMFIISMIILGIALIFNTIIDIDYNYNRLDFKNKYELAFKYLGFAYRPLMILVCMAFALSSISHFANKELAKKSVNLENANKEIKSFIIMISSIIGKSSTMALIMKFKDYIFDNKLTDYFFGICMYYPDYKKFKFISTFYTDGIQRNEKLLYDTNNTYIGYCINNEKDIWIEDLNDVKETTKFGISFRNRNIAGEANSLVCIPLTKNDKIIGALSIQNVTKIKYSEDEKVNLQTVGLMLSEIVYNIDENRLKKFIELTQEELGGKADEGFHFQTKTDIRPEKYNYLDDFLGWSTKLVNEKFLLLEKGKYIESHPINRILKGIAENRYISCGTILLIATSVCELTTDKIGNNYFIKTWNNIILDWYEKLNDEFSEKGDSTMYENFFRGSVKIKHEPQVVTETLISIYNLLKGLMIHIETQKLNITEFDYNLKKRTVNFTFGIIDGETLSKKIKDNIIEMDKGNSPNHDVSSEIATLSMKYKKNKAFVYNIPNNMKTLQIQLNL